MDKAENNKKNLRDAVAALAVGDGDVKTRLGDAVIHHFQFIHREALPDQLWHIYDGVMEATRKAPSYKGQSEVESALYRMHRKTASRIANQIWELFRAVHRV